MRLCKQPGCSQVIIVFPDYAWSRAQWHGEDPGLTKFLKLRKSLADCCVWFCYNDVPAPFAIAALRSQ
jgi:hypothetical protein